MRLESITTETRVNYTILTMAIRGRQKQLEASEAAIRQGQFIILITAKILPTKRINLNACIFRP